MLLAENIAQLCQRDMGASVGCGIIRSTRATHGNTCRGDRPTLAFEEDIFQDNRQSGHQEAALAAGSASRPAGFQTSTPSGDPLDEHPVRERPVRQIAFDQNDVALL